MTYDYLPSILNALGHATFVINRQRRIVLINDIAQERFGNGLVGQDFVRAVRHPDCLQAIDDVLHGLKRSRAVIAIEAPVRTTFEVSVASLGEDNADGLRAIVSLTDVSHVREAEQMRSDFVANVSHELRSPLTALSGFIETLKGAARDDPEARSRFLGLMDREAQRMIRLISDLLSLSKVEENERLRPTGRANVGAIVAHVVATLEDQANHENKRLVVQQPANCPEVPGDSDELTQVFQNLIENAIKYSGEDTEITVSMSTREQAPGIRGRAVQIDISDRGPGIPAAHISRLTERFYRVDDGRSRDKGGTGLGLAIVKHIVNRHRGRLQIRSEIDVGSTFSVILPASFEAI